MNKKILSILLIFTVILSGCTSVIDLTAEEEDLIAEYAAGMMTKKYKESKGLITEIKKEEPTVPETESDPVQQETTAPADASINPIPSGGAFEGEAGNMPEGETISSQLAASTLEQVLNVEGVELSVIGYAVEDRYPTDEYAFSVEATKGHKLLIVEYDVWNSMDADAVMKLDAENAVIKVVINGTNSVNVFKTMLKNDLLNMNETAFAPGEAKTGVLIFNISDELAEGITSVNVDAVSKSGN